MFQYNTYRKADTNIELSEGIRILTDDKRIITGINLSFGNACSSEQLCYGNIREVLLDESGRFQNAPIPSTEDSIYDLASVTKVFTAISILQLEGAGKLLLDRPVRDYVPAFSEIGSITVGDFLAFQKDVSTPERIDTASSREEALSILFRAAASPRPERRYYTDMGAMILKYVIEEVSCCTYFDYLLSHVLKPLGMDRTFAHVPDKYLPQTACYNYERRILPDGTCFLDTDCPSGTVHDPKARILSKNGQDLCGHAGLFSTVEDMTKLAQGLLSGAVLPRKTVMEMGRNRTGYRLSDGSYTHFLGYLCYAKHPVQTFSEVPACFSDRTIALNGFTGNHFSVDPVRNQFMIHLSNRIHNRITVATGRPDPANKTERLLWDDKIEYPVSQNYVYYKDEFLKNPIGEILNRKYVS